MKEVGRLATKALRGRTLGIRPRRTWETSELDPHQRHLRQRAAARRSARPTLRLRLAPRALRLGLARDSLGFWRDRPIEELEAELLGALLVLGEDHLDVAAGLE